MFKVAKMIKDKSQRQDSVGTKVGTKRTSELKVLRKAMFLVLNGRVLFFCSS